MTVESYSAAAASTGTPSEDTALLRDRRRRHSFHASRKLSCDYQDADTVFIRVSTLSLTVDEHWDSFFRL